MEKNKLRGVLVNDYGYTKEQIALIDAIEEARIQLENAREFFDTVNDAKLIDYAIYMEEAAKVRYTYLLAEAKKLKLKVDYSYRLNNTRAV